MKNIIVDDKNKVRHHFTITDGSLICKCGDSSITLPEVCRDVDCCTDEVGGIYAVAVCEKSIECCYNNGGGWRRYTAVTVKNDNCTISAIRAVCISGRLNMWYSMDCGDSRILIHQISDGEDMIGDPYAVGELGYKKKFEICCDYDKNTHIFFVDDEDRLCHMSYLWSEKRYSQREYISDRISHVSAVANKSGRIYVAAVGKKAEFNVIYFKELGDEDFRILGFGVDSCCTADVIDAGDKIYVQWMDNRECCECVSSDLGENFTRPVSVNSMRGGANQTVAYRNSANPLCMGVNRCMCNFASKMLHETAITESAGELVSMDEEMEDYRKSAEDMQVSFDVAERLTALENRVSVIEDYLQNMGVNEENNTGGGLCDE